MCLAVIAAWLAGNASGDDLREIVRSPYRIQAYVRPHKSFDAGKLWVALGVPEVLSDPVLGKEPVRAFDCQAEWPCRAWIEEVQLSATRRYVVLRLSQPLRELNRYLVFDNKSRLIGYIDSAFAKYFDPVLYTREVGNKWWLVLREQSGSGMGAYERTQRWFEVHAGKLREALSILDDGYMLSYPGWYLRRPSAFVTGYEHTLHGDRLRVLFLLDYTLADDYGVDIGLFGSIQEKVVYSRGNGEAAFRLSAAESRDIARIWPGAEDPTDFLQAALPDLMMIAHSPRSAERQWLIDNLPAFPASPERRQLLDALKEK